MKSSIKQSTLTFILNTASIILIALSITAFYFIVQSERAVDRANAARYDLVNNARHFTEASEYLTRESRAYAATGKKAHYDNYLHEADDLKNREVSLGNMRWIGLSAKETELVDQMEALSDGLTPLEKEAVRRVEAGDTAAAMQAVYGPAYENRASLIRRTQEVFIREIDMRTDDQVRSLMEVSRHWVLVTLVCLLVTALIQVVAAVAIHQKVIIPLIAVRDEMVNIARGDLSGEFKAEADGSEIGMLIGSIKSTKAELKKYIWDISDKLAAIAGGDLATRVKIDYIGDFTRIKEAINEIAGILLAQSEQDKKSRAELEEAYEGAQAANKSKSAFLSSMSHEIRTPINAIIGMTNIARSAADATKKDYCLDKVTEASTHLLGVINDVLDMSKIDANKLELSPVEFNIEKMLSKVVNIIGFRVEEKHQKLSVRIDRSLPRRVVADEQRLAQVLTNLLSNAVKFTPEKGAIHVEARIESEDDDGYTIFASVKDSGIGISKKQQDKLFTSFMQADAGISRKFGGTGLGLAISKNIVELMGGRIWVESEEGNGSTFAFVVRAGKGTGEERGALLPNVKWEEMRVLAVDDEPDVREYFKDIAERLGFSCDVAASGPEAVGLIERTGGYDIYFIDWHMPEMDGVELVSHLRALGDRNSAVIMISSAEWDEIEERAKEAGVDRFVPKPLFPSSIADAITECLGHGLVMPENRADEETPDFSSYHILLAEDVDINREIVLAMLEDTGINITCAANGTEAVAAMERQGDDFDMIFMDVQMPELDGHEATRRIRALENPHAKTMPIVAMTANVFREDVEACLAAGMDDHVGKPLDFDEVIDKLKEYLPKR